MRPYVFQERETGAAVIEAAVTEVAVTVAGIVIEAQMIGIADSFECVCTTVAWSLSIAFWSWPMFMMLLLYSTVSHHRRPNCVG